MSTFDIDEIKAAIDANVDVPSVCRMIIASPEKFSEREAAQIRRCLTDNRNQKILGVLSDLTMIAFFSYLLVLCMRNLKTDTSVFYLVISLFITNIIVFLIYSIFVNSRSAISLSNTASII